MTARKILLTMAIFVVWSLIMPQMVSAEEWISFPAKKDVAPDKVWTVEFNTAIDPKTIHSEDIYVVTVDGKQLFTPSYVQEDGRSITVLPPPDGYESGQTYTLFIKKQVQSANGRSLKAGYKMTFTVQRSATHQPEDEEVLSYGTVTASILNVRAEKTTASEKLGELERGDVVKIYRFDGYWAEIRYHDQTAYLHKDYLKLHKENSGIVEGLNIIIDAGHGGHDPGASDRGYNEKEINLDVADKVQHNLQKLGAHVLLTREDDTFLPLKGEGSRVEFSREHYGDIFVSIHTNAAGNESSKGAETYYDSLKDDNVYEGYLLAKNIQEQLVNMAGMFDRGVKNNNWTVIHYNPIPSVLVELGFITNPSDFDKLTSPAFRQVYADAITLGIVNYFKEEVK